MSAYVGDVKVRMARAEDVPAVAALCCQWEREGLTRNYTADSPEELAQRLGAFFLVAEAEGRIVGFAAGRAVPTAGNPQVEGVCDGVEAYFEPEDVYVALPWRGRGIGTRLVAELLARAQQRGVTASVVYSANHDYVRTARFYEALGYRMWYMRMTRGTR